MRRHAAAVKPSSAQIAVDRVLRTSDVSAFRPGQPSGRHGNDALAEPGCAAAVIEGVLARHGPLAARAAVED